MDDLDLQRKRKRKRKKLVPVIITVLLIVYYIAYFGILIYLLPMPLGAIMGIVPIILGPATVHVCMQRIDEINGGEEDDLSKY